MKVFAQSAVCLHNKSLSAYLDSQQPWLEVVTRFVCLQVDDNLIGNRIHHLHNDENSRRVHKSKRPSRSRSKSCVCSSWLHFCNKIFNKLPKNILHFEQNSTHHISVLPTLYFDQAPKIMVPKLFDENWHSMYRCIILSIRLLKYISSTVFLNI